MTADDYDALTRRVRHLTILWVIICTFLLVLGVVLTFENKHLRDELAKPVRLTYQQKHEVISEYHEHMDNETKWALRKIIGCKE